MEKHTRKTRCWACHSLDVIRWGKQHKKQRFKCKTCGILFTNSSPEVSKNNFIIWFKKWVLYHQTLAYISNESGYSERTLKYKFYSYLATYPTWTIPSVKAVYLVLDGTYFANKLCLFVYRNNELKNTLLYRTTDGEHIEEILEDLLNILHLGIIIISISCDGHKSIIKAIKEVNKYIKSENRKNNTKIKPIIIQRCLVHIQRTCLTYLKKEHHSITGQRLRFIAMTMTKIKTIEQRDLFISAFNYWFSDNKEYVMSKSYSDRSKYGWRTHKEVYSAYIAIKNALPNMFHYLNDDKIPETTNCIESYFSHLKEDIAIHRGLSKEHFQSFLRWYIYFKNLERG